MMNDNTHYDGEKHKTHAMLPQLKKKLYTS